jgi:hypothetical protein
VASLFISRAHFECGDEFAPALKLGRRHLARLAAIRTAHRLRTMQTAQLTVQRIGRNAIERRSLLDDGCAIGMTGGQRIEPAAQRNERFGRHGAMAAPCHYPASSAR